jgi:hypothetical protein
VLALMLERERLDALAPILTGLPHGFPVRGASAPVPPA